MTLARNSQIGPYVYPKVPAEFTNWRDEQVRWRETCGALRPVAPHDRPLRSKARTRSGCSPTSASTRFANFAVDKAKQFVACNYRRLRDRRRDPLLPRREQRLSLVGRPSAHNWVQFHAETGRLRRDLRARRAHGGQPDRPPSSTASRCRARRRSRCSRRRTAARCPRSSSSTWASSRSPATRCARCTTACPALPGSSCSGRGRRARTCAPRSSRPARTSGFAPGRLARLRDEHARVGLDPVPAPRRLHGRRPEGVPRVAARQRLRGTGSLGGSFYSDDIEDYYLTPADLGYGGFVKFDHDFIGREALEQMPGADRAARSRSPGTARTSRGRWARCSRRATARSTSTSRSRTTRPGRTTSCCKDGEMVGVSTFSGYSYNERSMLSLAIVDADVEYGAEVTLVWGEEGGGSAKPVVERHVADRDPRDRQPVPVRRGRARLVSAALSPVNAPANVDLLGLYWTVSGPVEVHVGREWSLFDWADRCAEARKVGLQRPRHLARRPAARARDAQPAGDEAGLRRQRASLPRARVHHGLVPRRGRRAAPGVRQDPRAALRGGRRVRRPPHQGRQHPRHARRALRAHRAVRRALRRRSGAHRCEDRLRVHAVRRQRPQHRRRARGRRRRGRAERRHRDRHVAHVEARDRARRPAPHPARVPRRGSS